jgi:hypothetical protein
MATTPTILSEPILVANLPLPQDLAAVLDSHWRACRFTSGERAFLEDDVKLRHHYAGHFVVATAGPPGLQIHAIDLEDPEEVDELIKRLQARGHRHVLCLFPTPWNDPNDQIITLNS